MGADIIRMPYFQREDETDTAPDPLDGLPAFEVIIEVRNGKAVVINKPVGVRVTVFDADSLKLEVHTEAAEVLAESWVGATKTTD